MDNKTNKEANHKVGDKISDSQLIRIFGNKIVLLRANGQQEVLYLREQDAKLDVAYSSIDEWNSVIKQLTASSFMVDPLSFTHRISDLAQLIDNLRLITAFKQGKSIGCRIGQLDEKSVGIALGLQTGDIILSVDDIIANNMENRLKIYKDVMNKTIDDTITVAIMCNKDQFTLEYMLKELTPDYEQAPGSADQFELKKIAQEEKVKIFQQRHKFAPTIEDIRMRERQNMKNKGTAPINIGGGSS